MCTVLSYEQPAGLLCLWETGTGGKGPNKSKTNRIEFWEVLLRLSFQLLAPHVLWFPHISNGPFSLTEKLSIPPVLEEKWFKEREKDDE